MVSPPCENGGMSDQRIYPDGARVEVWRPNRKEWVSGTVYGYEPRDGTWKYFVQLAGYHAMQPSDPTSWFSASEMRSAM
jgi:hypothetical protein